MSLVEETTQIIAEEALGTISQQIMCDRPRRYVGALSSSQVLTIVAFSYLSSLAYPASSSSSNTDFQTLLCLKLHLSDPAGLLGSWKQNESLHFCSWPGVTCSKTHASRVVALDLESSGLNGQIPACIANLTLLTRIHFPGNQLSGQIPPELGQLSRLGYLNLSSNSLSGSIPLNLSRCAGLQKLDLGSNMLSGGIPEGLGMLRNLSVLLLAGNSLTGKIPLSLGSSSSLVSLVLANNSLTGPIPSALANSSSLQVLDLRRNNLGGQIPPALFNSTSLQKLVLGWNNFSGSIPVLSNVDSPLQYLVLSVNGLAGTIPSSLGNFSSLRYLMLGGNNFQGSIPVSIGKIPNLQLLDMSYNNFSGTVPASLYNISSLTYLTLSINRLEGGIPFDIGYTLPSIRSLILQGNYFQGQIPPSLANATNLESINIGDNAFHGIIPSFGSLSNLNELILASNQLEAGDWSFLSSLTNCTKLEVLSLGTNIMQGNLPSSVGSLARSLKALVLHANKISGTIPPEIGNLTNLGFLRMEQNNFVGDLPGSIGNLANLTFLNLSRNKLSGQIPLSIGKLRQLNELYLQENNLSGPIPSALGDCKNLNILNLSCNTLNESIPKELFSLYSLSSGLDLSHNQLSGQIPQEIGRLINTGLLNFSNNHLSGRIPSTLGACVHLESLHMEGNFLDGRIPESFINLGGIAEIDLSRNNLSGEIPTFFQSFNSLKLLNLSFNNLEGQMPAGGIFQNSSEVFVQGNIMLCSSTPMLQLPLCFASSKHRRTSHNLKIVGITVALVLVSSLCVVFILLKRSKRSKPSDHPQLKELKNFSYADLVRATNGFSSDNLVGSGAYGSVYKGALESEAHAVAIKVFKLDQLGATKSFLAECEAFRNTRHRNLVRVISACSTCDHKGNDFKALIVEYMANGTLESWLYSEMEGPLSLGSRATIAVDIASALDYLHNHCMPPIVHCDLKPSNVLLDDVMGARVSDFGLAKFLHTSSSITSSTSLAGPRGSVGYIAPEYGFGSKISTEGDVYSYGIIILEMLTGKRPTDELFNHGLSLHKFVGNAFPHKIAEILDPNIIQNSGDEGVNNESDHATVGMLSCILQLVKLGLSCSVETPKDRPKMQDVYAEVNAIKQAFFSTKR
ncbi:probable LRR receptor-like serine/threonine-protein kinase At3g47570 [Phragmites australis]|uniref:probable LRR receptor-like serine/threonine-protein kinase At3g47570 n=1 Tax=Phragmites australis TaxID=29695 RepID=UPI002D7A1382|nr:probable LRR receptor-like serine/threonine-protein kinase At3g47570 [Phragmites australis]